MTPGGAVLLDTCAIIYLANRDPLPAAALALLGQAQDGDGILVSPVSAWEVGLLSRKAGPPSFQPNSRDWFCDFLGFPGVRLTPFTPEIAIDSAYLPAPPHGDPADRLLIATARALDVPILTSDRKILAYAEAGHVRAIAC